MSLASTQARGRRMAYSRMTSTVTIHRLTGAMVPDPVTGFQVPGWADVYSGPFRLGGSERGGSGSRNVTAGTVDLTLAVRVGHFPHDTEGLRDNDLIDVIAGENAGAVLRIVEAAWADQQTARRVPVIEAQRPGEWS